MGGETDFLWRDVGLVQNALSGKPYMNQHYPPGYAYVLAGMSLLTHDFFKAGITISVVASTLLGLVGYGVVSILFDRRLAFVTTLFVLLALLLYSYVASTDVLANFLLLFPLGVFFRREPTMGVCIQSGAAAGLACLVRYNAMFLLVGIPLAPFTVIRSPAISTDKWPLTFTTPRLMGLRRPLNLCNDNMLRTGLCSRMTRYACAGSS